jgi:hypothetical protein
VVWAPGPVVSRGNLAQPAQTALSVFFQKRLRIICLLRFFFYNKIIGGQISDSLACRKSVLRRTGGIPNFSRQKAGEGGLKLLGDGQ